MPIGVCAIPTATMLPDPAGAFPHVSYDGVTPPQCNGPFTAVGSWFHAWPIAHPAPSATKHGTLILQFCIFIVLSVDFVKIDFRKIMWLAKIYFLNLSINKLSL